MFVNHTTPTPGSPPTRTHTSTHIQLATFVCLLITLHPLPDPPPTRTHTHTQHTLTSYTPTHIQIQQIRRMNNLWNTDSLHIRPILKIPVPDSNESSRSGSPVMSSQRRLSNGQLSSLSVEKNHHKNRTVSSFNDHSLEEDEEVRSKNSPLSSRHAECDGEGVKSIAGIFSSADEQLILARQFADKLALRW